MLKILRKLNEGSLLQRTMMHIAVLVAGSASVVALTSVLLVSTARTVLPPHDATEAGDKADEEQSADSDADPNSPEAALGAAGARSAPKALAQARLPHRREGALTR
ncbi:hypothetical protein [Sorangium sp. So ce1000]|uniref:hypothetical protein n=1 Tax=Sorangium sp. So ce1000 TaxID=3133325 RepID=UPI003F5E3219